MKSPISEKILKSVSCAALALLVSLVTIGTVVDEGMSKLIARSGHEVFQPTYSPPA